MIRIHIRELVLHGIDPRDRRAIADTVQRELSGFRESRRITEGHSIDHLDAGTLRIQPRTHMRGLGRHIARTLRGALRR
jgi:hypothetical protein